MTGRHRADTMASPVAVSTLFIEPAVPAVAPLPDERSLDETERRSVVRSSAFRIIGTPVVAIAGVIAAGLTIRATGEQVYGLVTLVTSVGLLLPFVDLGIGAVAMTAVSATRRPAADPAVRDTLRAATRGLALVAAVIAAGGLVVGVADAWQPILGISSGPSDRWAITVAVAVFACTIPTGLGIRILIGVDRNDLAVLFTVANAVFGLAITGVLYVAGVRGIWFVLPPLTGIALGNIAACVVAIRASGLGRILLQPLERDVSMRSMLRGSLWMFLISLGIPFGIQVQRLVLAHLSTPDQLSKYALMAQLFGLGWAVLSTASLSMWPVFVKRRSNPEAAASLWRRSTLSFGAIGGVGAIVLAVLGPWVGELISGGTIKLPLALSIAFGALLVAQALHLTSGVLLVEGRGARWQVGCLAAMAAVTVVGSVVVAPTGGAWAVVAVTAAAVLCCQFIPDLVAVPRLIQRMADDTEFTSPPEIGGR